MSEKELAARYESAIRRLQPYIKTAHDGSLKLTIKNGAELDIDPVTFADLKRSLKRANQMIKNHEIDREEVMADLF